MLIDHLKLVMVKTNVKEFVAKAGQAKERAAALGLMALEIIDFIIDLDVRLNQIEERLQITSRPAPPAPSTPPQGRGGMRG